MTTAPNIAPDIGKPRPKKPYVIFFILLALIVSTFVLSFFYFMAVNKKPRSTQQPTANSPRRSFGEGGQPTTNNQIPPTIGLTSTPIPTPTPPQGPGQYACDQLGICNVYQDDKRADCPRTYADPHCLGQCSDEKVRCPK